MIGNGWAWGLVLAVGFGVSGCVNLGSGTRDGPRLFLLSSVADLDPVGQRRSAADSQGVVVGPVTVPELLNRPQLVTRPAPTRVEALEGAQWAEPLGENIPRVLAENLSVFLGTENVYRFPWDPAGPASVQVAVDVVRFDASPGGTARLEARWTVSRVGQAGPGLRRATRVAVPVDGPDPGDQVAALSEALSRLSRDIADAIRSFAP